MSDEKRLETLSEEIKLLKGEIKNSLTSVRDYLLNMELPSSEFSTILAALSGDNSGQKVNLDGGLGGDNKPEEPLATEEPEQAPDDLTQPPPDENLIDMDQPEDMMEEIPEDTPLLGEEEGDNPQDQGELEQPEDSLESEEVVEEPENNADTEELEIPEDGLGDELEDTENTEDTEETEDMENGDDTDELEEPGDENDILPEAENDDSGLPELTAEEEQPMELERTTADLNQGTPKVNMLANLINWVAKAKKEIGDEMLPTFLDVYGVSGHLSLELKEVILHLADRTKEKTEPCTDAEVWSQAMLSLHGILTGGDAPLNPAIPSWKEVLEQEDADEEIIEVDKQERPIKLKFVLPGSNGKDKEYCLDLTPEDSDEE
jgi:hypothetical protein